MDIERFTGLIMIQQAIAQAPGDLQAMMEAIVNQHSVMPQCNGIVIELLDGDQLYFAAASGVSASLIGLRLPLNASFSGLSVLTGEPLYCGDARVDPRVNREACESLGVRSMIVLPIPHNGQIVGVLRIHSAGVEAFDEEDLLLAHLLVGPIAVAFSTVAEADAIRAKSELQAVIKLKETLVSTVSHELRTPVTSIAGSLALLSSGAGGELSEMSASLVDIAARNADRLKRLVNDLLDMDRIDSGRLSFAIAPADLRDVMQIAAEENAPFATEAGVTLELTVPPTPVDIETDADRLLQALTNLISNAAKFSPAGSTVRLTLAKEDGTARIRVSDEGPGISEDFRSRLFDRFSQSPDTRGATNLPGTGLGLAITKGIVEQLGGTIRLVDTEARGATFEISLPLAAAARQAAVG